MKKGFITAVLVFAATAGAAAAPSRQAIYDEAQAAFDRGDWRTAVDGFARILLVDGSSSHTDGLIRARYAGALLNNGHAEEAAGAAKRAVGELAGDKSDENRASAYLVLGDAERGAMAMDDALDAYDRAAAALPADSPVRRTAIIGSAEAAMTVHPQVAAERIHAFMTDEAAFAALSKLEQAQLLTLEARAELNRGDLHLATSLADRAVRLAGPLSIRTTLAQSVLRADAGMIYAFGSDREKAREYLAFSGAGHIPNNEWLIGGSDLPVCDDAVHPDDVAVIQFGIAPDGTILGATPIYASRPGAIGVTFANAVRRWRISTGAVAKLDPFWRAAVRLELRCTTRPAPQELVVPFREATQHWIDAKNIEIELENQRAGLRSIGDRQPPRYAALVDTLRQAVAPAGAADHRPTSAEIDAALAAAGAPGDVRAFFAFSVAVAAKTQPFEPTVLTRFASEADLLAASPDGARAAAWLRTEAALRLESGSDFGGARPFLHAVVGLPETVLPAEDPVRAVAILHLSLIDRRLGDDAAADARLNAAGLSAEQCTLFDVRPVPTNTAISSSAFPTEALRWGFEGFVREAFDVAADGSVAGVRTVLAYPPFVFGAATEKAVAHFRYLPPTLNGRVLGCAGKTVNVRYVVPAH